MLKLSASTTKKLEFSLPELMKSALTSAKNKSAESISPKLSKLLTNNTIIQANNFYNYELGMIQSNYLDISTDSFSNEGDIIVYIMKLISNSYDNTGDIKFQYLFK